MKAEAVLELLAGRKVLRHKQQVFFLTADKSEANSYVERGCGLIPYAPRQWSEPDRRHYEVHVNHLLDSFVVEDVFGEKKVEYVELERLLTMLRVRDGVAFSFQEPR